MLKSGCGGRCLYLDYGTTTILSLPFSPVSSPSEDFLFPEDFLPCRKEECYFPRVEKRRENPMLVGGRGNTERAEEKRLFLCRSS